MSIKRIFARQIYDSRGNPTIEVDLQTEKGIFRSKVPSGASTGVHEALELRDGDKKVHHGKGVRKAIANVNDTIAPALIAKNFQVTQQKEIDQFMIELDGTDGFGWSPPLYQYIAELAGTQKVILPVPAFNVINGGSHAGNKLAMQEFMILPTGAKSFTEAMQIGTEIYHHLKNVIKKRYGLDATAVGDEGGFAPNIQSATEALDLIKESIEVAGYTGKVQIGLDVAASEFHKDGKYDLDFKSGKEDPQHIVTGPQLADIYKKFIKDYPVVSIEDAFDQDDWQNWSHYNYLP
ncbi:enolase [Ditylenchus destructor]|nr:enolase [Ditylenchus destructor]